MEHGFSIKQNKNLNCASKTVRLQNYHFSEVATFNAELNSIKVNENKTH